MNKKKYNKITLFLIPISILIVNIIFSIAFIGYVKINSITFDKKRINENTITSTLYNIIEIENENDSYVIYCLSDKYVTEEDEYLIAFKGETIEEINDRITDSDNILLDIICYWDESNIIEIKDFSNEEETLDYIDNFLHKTEDKEQAKQLTKEIKVYDLNSYIGYDSNDEDITLFFTYIILGYILLFSLFITVVEILIASLLKVTVFKNKFIV